LAHIDEIGPSFGEIKLSYERDGLCDLCTDGLFIWAQKGNHCGYKLRLEGLLVGGRDRELVLDSLSETVYRIKELCHTSSSHPSFTLFLRYTLAARRTAVSLEVDKMSWRRWTTKAG
jgi:hypothetical protein